MGSNRDISTQATTTTTTRTARARAASTTATWPLRSVNWHGQKP